MTLNFDNNGYLLPYQVIEVDLSTLENIFVFNKKRERLFINYLRWLGSFKNRVTPNFTQFINGSFISQKEFPKDIDFVTFFDYRIYEQEERFLDKYLTFSLENEGLDSYLVKTYPKEHERYSIYVNDVNIWENRYSKTEIDEAGNTLKKGFLKISHH
jgi:hypothetical protein